MKISLLCSSCMCFLNSYFLTFVTHHIIIELINYWTQNMLSREVWFFFSFFGCFYYFPFIAFNLLNLNISIELFNDINRLFFIVYFHMILYLRFSCEGNLTLVTFECITSCSCSSLLVYPNFLFKKCSFIFAFLLIWDGLSFFLIVLSWRMLGWVYWSC